jgi:hypothetical protein
MSVDGDVTETDNFYFEAGLLCLEALYKIYEVSRSRLKPGTTRILKQKPTIL